MTKIKLCGLSRPCDIEAANELHPDYVGFVFAKKSKRYVSPQTAAELKKLLSPDIPAVGVFVNEPVDEIAELAQAGVIDVAQLHGSEDEAYISRLRELAGCPVIKAYRVGSAEDLSEIEQCSADYILLDSGAGSGTAFNWELIQNVNRPYFLAGGLGVENVTSAITQLKPYAVDVSSGIETDGLKDLTKMTAFVAAVRKERKL